MLKPILMKVLANILLLSLLALPALSQSYSTTAQYKIEVGVFKSGIAAIETTQINTNLFGDVSSERSNGEYYITAQTNLTLQTGLKKGSGWFKLNMEHKKEFEKELCRIRVTKKETFEFYRKYVPEFSEEMKVMFKGYLDGTAEILFLFDGSIYLSVKSKEQADSLIQMLKGKYVNKEIDDIFK